MSCLRLGGFYEISSEDFWYNRNTASVLARDHSFLQNGRSESQQLEMIRVCALTRVKRIELFDYLYRGVNTCT